MSDFFEEIGWVKTVIITAITGTLAYLFGKKKQSADISLSNAEAEKTSIEGVITLQRYNKEAYNELSEEFATLKLKFENMEKMYNELKQDYDKALRKLNAMDTFKSINKL